MSWPDVWYWDDQSEQRRGVAEREGRRRVLVKDADTGRKAWHEQEFVWPRYEERKST